MGNPTLTLTLPDTGSGTLALDAREEVALPEVAKAELLEMTDYALQASGEGRVDLRFT